MQTLIRPAARARLWQAREAAAGIVVGLVGLWIALTTYGFVPWVGWALVALGLVMTLVAVQRLRFRQGGGGPGIVQIDERRVAYMGPLDGGMIDLDDLLRLELDPQAGPAWILSGIGGQQLAIPVNAEGADALFDLFAALPGLETEAMLTVLRRTPAARVLIWGQPLRRLH